MKLSSWGRCGTSSLSPGDQVGPDPLGARRSVNIKVVDGVAACRDSILTPHATTPFSPCINESNPLLSVLDLFAVVSFPAIDPIAFSIGPLAVHWYGLAYVAGILLGWLVARDCCAAQPCGRTQPHRDSRTDRRLHIWVAIGIVAGGRIGYILFYDFAAVAANPIRAIEVWNGGMSSMAASSGRHSGHDLLRPKARNCALEPVRHRRQRCPARHFLRPPRQLHQWRALGSPSMYRGRWPSQPAALSPPSQQLYEAALEGIVLFMPACSSWPAPSAPCAIPDASPAFSSRCTALPGSSSNSSANGSADRLSRWQLADHGHGAVASMVLIGLWVLAWSAGQHGRRFEGESQSMSTPLADKIKALISATGPSASPTILPSALPIELATTAHATPSVVR